MNHREESLQYYYLSSRERNRPDLEALYLNRARFHALISIAESLEVLASVAVPPPGRQYVAPEDRP